MAIKTKLIKHIDVVNEINLYGVDSIEFVGCENDGYSEDFYPVHCKEELGADCVRDGLTNIIVCLPQDITDKQIEKLTAKMHKFEKEVKAPKSKIYRIKGYEYEEDAYGFKTSKRKLTIFKNMLFVSYGTRWACNSAAHAVYTTHLRKFILEATKAYKPKEDIKHLKQAKWLIQKLKKHGISIFGCTQHEEYDVGMVSLLKNLDMTQGCLKPKLDDAELPPEPKRSDFEDEEDYYDALDDWDWECQDAEDDFYELFGDLDERIPDNHGYGKIEKLYVKDFVKKQKVQKKVK